MLLLQPETLFDFVRFFVEEKTLFRLVLFDRLGSRFLRRLGTAACRPQRRYPILTRLSRGRSAADRQAQVGAAGSGRQHEHSDGPAPPGGRFLVYWTGSVALHGWEVERLL